MSAVLGVFLIAGLIALYFLPCLLASGKKHSTGIIILNVFLGWSIVGWIAALIWAVSDEKQNTQTLKKCHFCAEFILSDAVKCRHCGELLILKENNTKNSEVV